MRLTATRRRKRLVVGVLVGLFVLAVVGVVSAWLDLRPARAQVRAARKQLERAIDPAAFDTPERRASSRARIATAQDNLASARRRVDRSPVIRVARFVPGLRGQRAGLLTLLDDARRGSATALALFDRVQSLGAGSKLRDAGVPLDSLELIASDAKGAARELESLQRSSAGLWGPLGSARRRLDEALGSAATSLSEGSELLGATHGFLGGNGERRYLLAIQNNAEMRDQGTILSYAVLRFSAGRFQAERRGSISEIRLSEAAPTPIPPGTQEVFGASRPTALWQSVNTTADFEWSGRAMVDMYRQATGQEIDGVIAIDVPGLAALLRVVGSVRVAGVAEPISDKNAGRILLHDLYQGLSPGESQRERRDRLDDVAGAVIERLSTGNADVVGLGGALGRASRGGHLRLWSRVESEEQIFVRAGVGGGPAAKEADRTFHLAVENGTATKLDYYVRPTVRQDVELQEDGAAVVRTTVVVDNRAPVGAPASYALGPDGITNKQPGEYLAWVLLWGPLGSIQANSTAESGLVLSQHVAALGAGQRREVIFTTTVPNAVRGGRLTLRLVPQPRLEPMGLEVHLRAPGWRVTGAPEWRGPWDRTRRLSWKVDR